MPGNYNPERNSIFLAGIILIVYEAIMLMIFFFLSDPILSVLEGIFAGTTNIPEMSTFSPIILTVFNIIFAIAFIIPVIWFFVWIYQKEHGYQFRRFY